MSSNFHGLILTPVSLKFGPIRSPGPYRIAHSLRNSGWDIDVVDYINHWKLDDLKIYFSAKITNQTKFIGISFLFTNKELFPVELITWIKKKYPHLKIIVGGSEPFIFYDDLIDYVISGYGEKAILSLLHFLFSNGEEPKHQVYKNTKIIHAIHSYPSFPLSSYRIAYQKEDFLQPYEWLGTEISRGCKFKCGFCTFPVTGIQTDTSRTEVDFEREMKDNYYKYGIDKYIIADETFNDRTEKITKFANVVQNLDFNPLFSGYIRADLLTRRPHELEELLRMNFLLHFYGIETFNRNSGKSIGKGMHPDEQKQGLIDIKNYFSTHGTGRYRGQISLISGLPHETRATLEQTKQWLIDNWQGQSFAIGALVLGHDDKYNLMRKSLLQQNYKKHGYEIIDVETLKNDPNIHYVDVDTNDIQELIWKNEHMNLFDAVDIEDEFTEIANSESYNFMLEAQSFPLIMSGSGFDVHVRHKYKDMHIIHNHVNTYIFNKLNNL